MLLNSNNDSTTQSQPPIVSSVPHHFRYVPARNDTSSPFFNPDPDEGDPSCPVPSVNPAAAKTRLEILKSWEVNFTILSLYTVSSLAFLYVLITLHRTAYTWRFHHDIPEFTAIERFFRFSLACSFVILPLYFVLNLLLTRVITHEQLWTCALLAVGLLTTNPLTRSFATPVASTNLILTDATYTATVYLYLLLAAHSYRVLDDRHIYSVKFYSPKFIIALTYFIVKLAAGFNAGVSLGLIPFSRVLTWLILALSGRSTLRITVPVLLTAAMDVGFGFWLVHQVSTTAEYLNTVSYVSTRTKQLGFRCFVYQTLAFCLSIIGLSLLITIGLPRSYLYFLYDHPHHIFMLEPPVARLGLAFVYFTWTLVLAYVNLPAQPFTPFLEVIIPRARSLLARYPRLAVWAGLADVINTTDHEDAPSDEYYASTTTPTTTATTSEPLAGLQVHTPVLSKASSFPLRYRHREIYDDVSPRPTISPLALPPAPARLQNARNHLPDPNLPSGYRMDRWFSEPPPISASQPIDIEAPPIHDTGSPQFPQRRLRMRKNLFVMETQVLLVNAAFLSYIPGNPNEELPRENRVSKGLISPIPTVRAPTFDDIDNQLDALDLEDEYHRAESSHYVVEPSAMAPKQPKFDDGTNFLVDPYETALKNGMRIVRHFSDTKHNVHVVVLFGQSRVVVAFSGTRDMKNWGMNAMTKRAVLDEKLSRFEYEHTKDPLEEKAEEKCSCDEDEDDANEEGHVDEEEKDKPRGFFAFRCRKDRKIGQQKSQKKEKKKSRAEDHNCSPLTKSEPGGTYVEQNSRTSRRDSTSTKDSRSSIAFHRSHSMDRLGVSRLWQDDALISDDTSQPNSYGAMEGGHRHGRGTSIPRGGFMRSTTTWEGLLYIRKAPAMSAVALAMANELMTFGKPKVHEGFLTGYCAVRKKVLGILLELYGGDNSNLSSASERRRTQSSDWGIAKGMPLFFTGHSLGGGMATFGAYESARYFRRIGIARRQDVSCTTFGCPRVGNEAFKMRYERLVETHWRFELASDPIPRWSSILNYVPVGVQVLIDQSGTLLIDPSMIEVRWWGGLSNLYHSYILHSRASYCLGLRAYCRRYQENSRFNDDMDDLDSKFWVFPLRYHTGGLFDNS